MHALTHYGGPSKPSLCWSAVLLLLALSGLVLLACWCTVKACGQPVMMVYRAFWRGGKKTLRKPHCYRDKRKYSAVTIATDAELKTPGAEEGDWVPRHDDLGIVA